MPGLKPNGQIILLMQGEPRELHFDIRNNRVISYDGADAVDRIATAFIAAAAAFENDRKRYVESVTKTLSRGAIVWLMWLAAYRKVHGSPAPFTRVNVFKWLKMQELDNQDEVAYTTLNLHDSINELTSNRIIYTDYQGADLDLP